MLVNGIVFNALKSFEIHSFDKFANLKVFTIQYLLFTDVKREKVFIQYLLFTDEKREKN